MQVFTPGPQPTEISWRATHGIAGCPGPLPRDTQSPAYAIIFSRFPHTRANGGLRCGFPAGIHAKLSLLHPPLLFFRPFAAAKADMSHYEDIWYAARSTRIVYMPPKLLESFGASRVQYLVVSEDMDHPGRLTLRSGVVTSERPRVITPAYFRSRAVENFGEDARRYLEEVLSRDAKARFLEYGLRFGKDKHHEDHVSGNPLEVAEQAAAEAQDNLTELKGVLVGPDDAWEVSLMHFLAQMVQRSLPFHARDIARKGLFQLDDGVPRAIRQELQEDFEACGSLDDARRLGEKLRAYGLFEAYEDQFYDLYRRLMKETHSHG